MKFVKGDNHGIYIYCNNKCKAWEGSSGAGCQTHQYGFILPGSFCWDIDVHLYTTGPGHLNIYLQVPENQQGVLSGNLTFMGEIIIILSIGLLGALSDKIGRKLIFSEGSC